MMVSIEVYEALIKQNHIIEIVAICISCVCFITFTSLHVAALVDRKKGNIKGADKLDAIANFILKCEDEISFFLGEKAKATTDTAKNQYDTIVNDKKKELNSKKLELVKALKKYKKNEEIMNKYSPLTEGVVDEK